MSSAEVPSPAVKEEMAETSVDAVLSPADALYEKCAQRPTGQIFFQRDLSNMNVANTMAELTVLLRELCDRHLLKLMTFEGDPCWKLRTREDADKLRRLTPDERLLYHHIDQVQADGIWSKALRNKTNVTQQTLTKCLKSLESKDLVQSVMSVKYPNRKMYLLKHLKPSEDIAGGPWQTDGEFDTALIETISGAVAQYVEHETCIKVPGNWNDYDRSVAIAQKKASALDAVRDIEEAPAVRSYKPPRDPNAFRIVHRHKPHYPTAASVAEWLNGKELIKAKTVREEDMEQLLEMMVAEDRLEKTSGTNYRTVLKATNTKVYNGFVDAPCGNCPVFDQCGDEGEISARTCVYFGQWLDTESEEY
ncbi:RPC34 DNA-directed RNA polymerase III subunit C34 [Pyrenophora tritici-repentis]|uniref:DNA-directed RNA polymerase III subunit RPC6 n=2 Tax=Pyrenophora tritici-repentis TaxID=45151 RepID=A0A2W1DJF9_9PLEO|nr:DNA-directed rna polymerase III subunit [Pyrenophora tritici-repentis Pt-1C-BFP]KAA8620936.1 dna-directed rna polymerase iii subunit rpc6 [Pyrenophora tritici-repentis]EDU43373.1 DNA-directed rna polymerase III subunit [Pyrenophora tritici-repentis Pt-1C-BFP]KAF7450181.1 dna-directed rna polymerase iii protein [Pyrenophora tritici-repentis]KAF7572749.1 RPC34, DNA-directed RNA polymerase III, subunit C34 [Pyrenophora tritici-repentis]KAG9376153.1 dna-directed rna polymerase iii protein [Pyre